MRYQTVTCHHCKKGYLRSTYRIKEALSNNWEQFCSKKCLAMNRTTSLRYNCSNSKCSKTFIRILSQVNKVQNLYCSRSCAVSANNNLWPKRKALIKDCLNCNTPFTNRKKYCSRPCRRTHLSIQITGSEVVKMIKEFYMQRVRIPYKYEFTSSKAARRRFGSWNKAVIAAGFEPNPVKFAKKHEALDGHKCDSMAEKIIDDWLYDNKITHQREVRYFDSNFTADFKIGEVYIEYFGLKGQHYKYDDALKRKMALIKKNKLKLIAIYPRDIKNQARLNLALSKIGQ